MLYNFVKGFNGKIKLNKTPGLFFHLCLYLSFSGFFLLPFFSASPLFSLFSYSCTVSYKDSCSSSPSAFLYSVTLFSSPSISLFFSFYIFLSFFWILPPSFLLSFSLLAIPSVSFFLSLYKKISPQIDLFDLFFYVFPIFYFLSVTCLLFFLFLIPSDHSSALY